MGISGYGLLSSCRSGELFFIRCPPSISLLYVICYLRSAIGYLFMQLTHFLAQLLGLYCVIVAVAMFVRKREMIEIVSESDPRSTIALHR
jgi:hypothetical protein